MCSFSSVNSFLNHLDKKFISAHSLTACCLSLTLLFMCILSVVTLMSQNGHSIRRWWYVCSAIPEVKETTCSAAEP